MSNNPVVSPSSYNIYDKGYRTGAQTSIFIGPIWLEEALQIQISTGTNDIPVYPYASPYYSRLLLGKYIVSGTLGITYTEPDYLLRVIELARNESIQDRELYNLIERRKSIFADTLKYRMLTEKVLEEGGITKEKLAGDSLTSHLYNYVDRITREIETTSIRGRSLDPQNFELTIIRGNPYDTGQSIEIFENVKIVGTASVVVNDDNALMEVYSFTARKKPDRVMRTPVSKPNGYFSIDNLMMMAKELAEKLVGKLLEPPAIDVRRTMSRTGIMDNTDRLAVAGILRDNSVMYGKDSQFMEILWELQYDKKYKTDKNDAVLLSDTHLTLFQTITGTSGTKSISTKAQLRPPVWENQSGDAFFDNSYGKLAYPDRLGCSKYISAVSQVEPVPLAKPLGGSIILPRYKRNEVDIGFFLPPKIPTERDQFTYVDQLLPSLTATTLWNCPIGFRSTASTEAEEYTDAKFEDGVDYVREVSQPVFSYGYIEKIEGIYQEDFHGIAISEPVYIDYKNISKPEPKKDMTSHNGNESSTKTFRSETIFKESEYERNIVLTRSTDGELYPPYLVDKETEVSSINEKPDATDVVEANYYVKVEEIVPETVYEYDGEYPRPWTEGPVEDSEHLLSPGIYQFIVGDICANSQMAYECKEDHEKETTFDAESDKWTERGVWFDAKLMKVTTMIDGTKLSTDLNKCLYVRPFVFATTDTVKNVTYNSNTGKHTATYTKDTSIPDINDGYKFLAYMMSKKENHDRDDSCDFNFDYHWTITNATAFRTTGQDMNINIVYFCNPKTMDWTKVTSSNGDKVAWEELTTSEGESIPARKFYVAWLTAILPIKRVSNDTEKKKQKVKAFHDMQGPSGRKLQLYNITRCDIKYMNKLKWYNFNPTGSVARAIKNAITHSFEDMISIYTDINYHFPVKLNLNRISAFLRGYAFSLNLDRITNQILKATFTDDGEINRIVPIPPNSDTGDSTPAWTLEKALSSALDSRRNQKANPHQDLALNLYSDIATIVREEVTRQTTQKGMRLLKESPQRETIGIRTGEVTIYRDVMTPAPDVVSWGLTEDGYEELKKTSALNAGGTKTIIRLGGYK